MTEEKDLHTFLEHFLNAENVYKGERQEKQRKHKRAHSVLGGLWEDNQIPVDIPAWGSRAENLHLNRRTKCFLALLLLLVPFTLWFGITFFDSRRYMIVSMLLLLYSMIPFFLIFEGRKPKAREVMMIAVWSALTVAARAAFFMLPNFKPVAAMVIIGGVTMGPEAGFLAGCISMLTSNFIFGQGPWTPWQMISFGLIGFFAGILFRKGILKRSKVSLCSYGFLAVVFLFGGIMNTASLFMYSAVISWEGLLAMYISGLPVDLVHAVATVLFLWVGARPLIEKIERVQVKWGILR